MVERLIAASWLCWTGPLFIAESILQGRKIFVRRAPKVELEDNYTPPEKIAARLPVS